MLNIAIITITSICLCTVLSFSQSITIHSKTAVKTYSMADIDSITFELGEEIEQSDFKIYDGEISAWKGIRYNEFSTCNDLMNVINGGAGEYCEYDIVRGFSQVLSGGNSEKTVEILFMELSTLINAAALYNQKESKYMSTKEAAGSHAATTAFLVPNDYGYMLIANVASYYICLNADILGADKSEAKNTVLNFFEVLLTKIESQK